MRLRTEDLIEYYQKKSMIENDNIAKTLLEEFGNKTDINFHFIPNRLTWPIEYQLSRHLSVFIKLNDSFPYSLYRWQIFFQLRKKYNYRMNYEIKKAISKLVNLENPCHNKELIQSLLSPIINNISFDGKDTFKIYSNDCGNFSFGLAANYFQNNPEILKYMEENQLNNYCHQHTEKLAKIYPQYVSITSLCHNYFVDGFYHSYTYNPDDKKIIDLCKKIVMDKEEYDCLQGAKEISFIPNSEIKKAYRQTLRKTIQPKRRYMIFKIALYNQLKNLTEEEATLIKSYKKINR